MPTPTPVPPARAVIGVYSGDGTPDFAVFRRSAGRRLIRGVTSAYYGASTDVPVTNP